MWLGKNESAAYWMSVVTDMKARGLEDILSLLTITSTDLPKLYAPFSLNKLSTRYGTVAAM